MDTQLILFDEIKEDQFFRELECVKQQSEKIRKSLFAKYTELMSLYLEQKDEIEMLKQKISKT